jgi:hypothetical protein
MDAREWGLICAWLLVGAFVVLPTISLWLHARLIRCLRSKHHVLWLDLGAPTLASVAMRGGVPFGGVNFRLGSGGNKYLDWLSTQGNRDVHDDEVAQLGEKLRGFGCIAPLVLLVLAVAVGFMAHKMQSRGR